MRTRVIPALSAEILGPFTAFSGNKPLILLISGLEKCSPKAEVRGSNPFGRASKFNRLPKLQIMLSRVIAALPVLRRFT